MRPSVAITRWTPWRISGTSVYAGGYFTSIGGQTRNYLAKLSSSGTGAADATWNPNANGDGLCHWR